MKLSHELYGLYNVVRYSVLQIIQIKASDLNRLKKRYPRLEKFLRHHVISAKYINLDEDLL